MKIEYIVKEFKSESDGLVDEAMESLKALAKNPKDTDAVNNIFRVVHTLKGGANFAQMTEVGTLSHRFETLLLKLRNESFNPTESFIKSAEDIFSKFKKLIKKYFDDKSSSLTVAVQLNEVIIQMADSMGVKDLSPYTPNSLSDESSFSSEHKHTPLYQVLNEEIVYRLKDSEDSLFNNYQKASEKNLVYIKQCLAVLSEIENNTVKSNQEVHRLAHFLGLHFSYFENNPKSLDEDDTRETIIQAMDILESQIKLDLMSVYDLKVDINVVVNKLQFQLDKFNIKEEVADHISDSGSLPQVPFNQFQEQEFSVRINPETFNFINSNIDSLQSFNIRLEEFVEKLQSKEIAPEIQSELEGLSNEMSKLEMNFKKARNDIQKVPLVALFQRMSILIKQVSGQLDKEIVFESVGEKVLLQKTHIEILKNCLFHLVRNSADHGIEIQDERVRKGKPSYGTIAVGAMELEDKIVIEFKDDGKGINPEKIKRKILSGNFLSQKELDKLSEKEVINYVFKPGFTTAEKVSEISGRGVGLDAVQQFIKKMHGTISIDSKFGEYTQFVIEIPKH